jgi:molybdopterin converting factor small subunit
MSETINVTVKLFAQYRDGKFKVQEMSFPKGSTAIYIVDSIGIDHSKLPIGVLMVNARHVEEDYILKDGDIFTVFPKVGGG